MGDTHLDGQKTNTGFIRGLGLLDSTMIVAGSMIGSGIFIVSGGISKQVGAPGWLLVVWIAFHIVISALHSTFQLGLHVFIFAVILYFVFRRDASSYFHRDVH